MARQNACLTRRIVRTFCEPKGQMSLLSLSFSTTGRILRLQECRFSRKLWALPPFIIQSSPSISLGTCWLSHAMECRTYESWKLRIGKSSFR